MLLSVPPRMLLPIVVLLLVTLQATKSSAQTCTFYHSSGRLTCGPNACTAVRTNSLLPAGHYLIGSSSNTWFNLYPYSGGNYWDYHSGVPGLGCRAGFAIHSGSYSKGCITVTDSPCMARIASYLSRRPLNSITVNECNDCFGPNCLFGRCRCGIGTLRRSYIGSLYVYN